MSVRRLFFSRSRILSSADFFARLRLDRRPGSGSGYLCGLFHSLVQPGGTVLGIDHLPELVDMARRNLARDPSASAVLCPDQTSPVHGKHYKGDERTMQVIQADGREGAPTGFVPEGGWQAIHVGAAAPSMPQALIEQARLLFHLTMSRD